MTEPTPGLPYIAALGSDAAATFDAVAAAMAATGSLTACRRAAPAAATALAPGATVLAVGDSITHGTGAPEGASSPPELSRLTGWQVVNAGVPGDTAAQVLARLPALLAEHRPALVILCAGGNDFLRRLPEEGESFTDQGWHFEVVDMDGRKIDKLRVHLVKKRKRNDAVEHL